MITAERSHLLVAAKSHPGMSGKNNEDRYSVSAYHLEGSPDTPSVLAIVSDGIGGHKAGEIAAEIAVETISRAVANSDARRPQATLFQAVIEASETIYEQSELEDQRRGMGATCACGWVIGDRLYTVTVGDSRIYLVRGDRIQQISTDHTWIQEALEQGAITEDEARSHPNAHVIRRYLGSRNTVLPDLRIRLRPEETDEQAESNQGLQLLPDDTVILCSDGLTDLVEDDEILEAFRTHRLEEAIGVLIDLANSRGGHDNITLVALRTPPTPITLPETIPPVEEVERRSYGVNCWGTLLLLLAGAALIAAIVLLLGLPLPGGGGLSDTPTPQSASTAPPLPGVIRSPTFETRVPGRATPVSVTPSPSMAPTRTPLPGSPRPGPTLSATPDRLRATPTPVQAATPTP